MAHPFEWRAAPPPVVPGSLGPMQEPHNEGPDDWFFDDQTRRWLRHSGKAHWRRILAERAADREPRPVRRLFHATRPDGYAGVMRRPDIELTDEAAQFVEQHPDEIAVLAGRSANRIDPAALTSDELEVRRRRFRAYIRERRNVAATPETQAGADAFLARFTSAG